MEQKVLRISTVVLVCSLLLRLMSTGVFADLFQFSLSSNTAAWMIFLQTGRLVRPAEIIFHPSPQAPTEPTEPEASQPIEESVLTFSPDLAEGLALTCSFSYSADLPTLLSKPLSWELTGDAPTVLILHSHASESFAGDYEETSAYHTTDTSQNMVSIGKHVADRLEEAGIKVLHDTTLHDTPSYNAAYGNSRQSAADYLAQYPSIRLILDLHRDSFEDEEGNQIVQTVFSEGEVLAPVMLVVGTNYGGLEHPNWQENLALALKLQIQMESLRPGICRKINLRSQRFNQDLSTGALLVEVGASGNSHAQALKSADVLADAIVSLAHGSR